MEVNKITLNNFSESLAFGKEGEHRVAIELFNRGFYVMPLYQFSDALAPAIYALSQSYTAPDLIACKDGKVYFVEVKRERQWVRGFNGTETGVTAKLYDGYKRLSDDTGVPLFVVFLQDVQEPTGVYMTEIHNEHTRSWNGRGLSMGYLTHPIVYFTSESLKRLC